MSVSDLYFIYSYCVGYKIATYTKDKTFLVYDMLNHELYIKSYVLAQ